MSTEIKPSSERRCTNVPALVVAIVFIGITLILVTYCGVVALLRTKSIKDYDIGNSTDPKVLKDGCGNICGENNPTSNNSICGDNDKRGETKLLMNTFDEDDNYLKDKNYTKSYEELNQCVSVCPEGYEEISNRCFTSIRINAQEMLQTLQNTWYYVLAICFVAFIFSYVFLILFRYAAKYVIWVINIGFVVLVLLIVLLAALAGSIEGVVIFGIIAALMIFFLVYFRKRIALVAKLFKEASKALIDVTALMFEPILTFIALIISFLIFATFFVIISFAGDDDPMQTPAHFFNFVSFIFITQFIIGCQNFIIAGTIVRWYFTRDKTKLRKPIRKSFSHLFKFHLGSVCLGAILITLVKLARYLTNYIKNTANNNKNAVVALIAVCFMCLIDLLEQFLAYLVRNAYIIIAKEGTPLLDSGKRSCRLLMDNINDVIALNHFGDLVLFVCRLLIVLIAGCVGYTVLSENMPNSDYIALPLILGCILAFLIAHCFVMVFEMTVDTIFVSFCIDIEENDGDTKPFYMSESLKRVIMDMKDYSGNVLVFGPKPIPGFEGGAVDGSGIPMMPPQQPMYPNIGYDDPKGPPQYPPQQYPSFPQQPYSQQPPYPQQPLMPPQGYPANPYQPTTYPQKS
ncbi:hypothetical protein ACKWTF_014627 [Chironomus riparius]